MTGVATATVEALTAEVRCLMVGSRQVTLSVYKQLDRVPAEAMQMFGRVRSNDKTLSHREIEVVGTDEAGVLSRSSVYPPTWSSEGSPMFSHWCYHYARRSDGRYIVAERAGHKLVWDWSTKNSGCAAPRQRDDVENAEWCSQHGCYHDDVIRQAYQWLQAEQRFRAFRGDFCDMDHLRAVWTAEAEMEAAELASKQAVFDRVEALPLIVLAGLK